MGDGTWMKRCKAKNRTNGKRCKSWAVEGTTVCRMHGGMAPQVVRKGQERVEDKRKELKAIAAVEKFGLSKEISPGLALLEGVWYAHGVVAYLRQKTRELSEDELAGMMITSVKVEEGVEGLKVVETRTASVNVWVRLLGEWEDRLARIAKTALDAGVAERQVKILEQQASLIAEMTYGMLVDLGVEMNEDTMAIIRRHMLSIEIEEISM